MSGRRIAALHNVSGDGELTPSSLNADRGARLLAASDGDQEHADLVAAELERVYRARDVRAKVVPLPPVIVEGNARPRMEVGAPLLGFWIVLGLASWGLIGLAAFGFYELFAWIGWLA